MDIKYYEDNSLKENFLGTKSENDNIYENQKLN